MIYAWQDLYKNIGVEMGGMYPSGKTQQTIHNL